MRITLKSITPNIEDTIVEIARVSSSRKDKTFEGEKLLKYLIDHKHWSPFEHGFLTMEIETSKAIGIQLLRHRSFYFQELSQRYQDVGNIFEDIFEEVELREKSEKNRQSSTNIINPLIGEAYRVNDAVGTVLEEAKDLYKLLLTMGVASECARMVLPMATKTRIFMTGNVRSWIHFLEVRHDEHAQKEIFLIAEEIKKILVGQLPIIATALGW